MLKKVIYEIYKVRGKKLYQALGDKNYYLLHEFLMKRKTLYRRRMSAFRKYADMLDLPVGFIIRIIKLGELDP